MSSNKKKRENSLRNDKEKAIIFDLDGTLVDFKKIDKMIIQNVFKNNIFIRIIDEILWLINDVEIMPNNSKLLSIRLFFYSIFSKHSYKEVYEYYEKIYIKEVKQGMIEKEHFIKKVKDNGYKVIILSNNPISKKILNHDIIVPETNKTAEIKLLMQEFDLRYIIGNNYSDDIKVAKKLGIEPIYIGESSVIKFLARKNFLCICSLEELM